MQIQCRTLFDITATGVTGHYKPSQIPFNDRAGNTVADQLSWGRSRNQQRNWETVTQLLQLRTQLFDVSTPVKTDAGWTFVFTVEFEGIYQLGQNMFGILENDCNGVPMLTGLSEQHFLDQVLTTSGSQQNIWFDLITVNN
jgi:hypothetical protein